MGHKSIPILLSENVPGPESDLAFASFHRWLILGNAIDAEPKLGLPGMRCPQTVHDVVARLPVNDVAARVT